MNFSTEPTLEQIDDYNNHESREKRWTIRLIIAGIVVAGSAYAYLIGSPAMPKDYIDTPENPGLGIKLR